MFTPISATIATARSAVSNLSLHEQRVYTYFLDLIGTTRVPVYVPLYILNKKFNDVSGRTNQRTIKKLVDKGIIERFKAYKRSKSGKIIKACYYRVKLFPDQAPLL